MFSSKLPFVVLLVQLTWVCAERSLSVSLTGPSEVMGVDSFIVTANITNTGNEELKLYRDPQSVLSKFPGNSFRFTGDNSPSFVGALAHYAFGAVTDFVTLLPGESTSVTHNLAAAYNFTTPGNYTIDVNRKFYFYDPQTQGPSSILATSSLRHTAKLSGSLVSTLHIKRGFGDFKRSEPVDSGNLLEKRFRYSTVCTLDQVSSIQDALPISAGYVTDSIDYLIQGTGGPRFTQWFGPYTIQSSANVLDHFIRIQYSDPNTYSYTCCVGINCRDCDANVLAYVYPSQYSYVYFCPPFWASPLGGDESMAGIIIHEASHFVVNGGTDDLGYGKINAHNLALTNPANAMNNADNYRIFAENTPALL